MKVDEKACKSGVVKKARKSHVSLDPHERRKLGFLKAMGVSRRELSRMFDVSTGTVKNIKPVEASIVFTETT